MHINSFVVLEDLSLLVITLSIPIPGPLLMPTLSTFQALKKLHVFLFIICDHMRACQLLQQRY